MRNQIYSLTGWALKIGRGIRLLVDPAVEGSPFDKGETYDQRSFKKLFIPRRRLGLKV